MILIVGRNSLGLNKNMKVGLGIWMWIVFQKVSGVHVGPQGHCGEGKAIVFMHPC